MSAPAACADRGSGLHPGILGVAFASLFAFGLSDNARGPLFPDLLLDMRLSDASGSLMFAMNSAGFIMGSLLFPSLLRAWAALHGLIASLVLAAIGLWLTSRAETLLLLVLASVVYGFALCGMGMSQNLMVETASPLHLRRRCFAGLHSMYAVASLLAPLTVVGLGACRLDWRESLALLALAPLAVALGSVWVRPLPPRAQAPPRSAARSTVREMLPLALVGVLTGCCVVAEILVSTRLPLLLRREGFSSERASLLLSSFFACLLAGRLLFTLVPVGISNRSLLALSAGGSLLLFLLGLLVEPTILPLVALTIAPFFPTAMDLLAEEFPARLEQAMAWLFAITSALLAISHFLVGLLSDVWTLRAALGLGPAALVTTLLLLAWTGRAGRAAAPAS